MRPQGLCSRLFAPTLITPLFAKYLQYFEVLYVFSISLQFFVIVLTSTYSCTCKYNHCTLTKQLPVHIIYNTIYSYTS